jgi:hypothetical protein
MGACNCGHLVQTLTTLSRAEIHRLALQKAGDWGEQAYDYCPDSGYPIDHIIGKLIDAGLTRRDIDALERLNDKRVIKRFPVEKRKFDRRCRADTVRYLRAWAELLEEELEAQPQELAS